MCPAVLGAGFSVSDTFISFTFVVLSPTKSEYWCFLKEVSATISRLLLLIPGHFTSPGFALCCAICQGRAAWFKNQSRNSESQRSSSVCGNSCSKGWQAAVVKFRSVVVCKTYFHVSALWKEIPPASWINLLPFSRWCCLQKDDIIALHISVNFTVHSNWLIRGGKKQIKKGNKNNLEVLKPIESWIIAADLSLLSTAPIFAVGKIQIWTSKADSGLCAGTLQEL